MKLIECPRDAMQGIKQYIPAQKKAAYINLLLKAGFDTIDFGSFVSHQAVPQMKDTVEVLELLDLSATSSKLLAIIANERGAEEACRFEQISYLGYPFSISETFQRRNANSTIGESLLRVEKIMRLCGKNNKTAVIYISMAFGNPYGDKWNPDIAAQWIEKLTNDLGVRIIALADTVGVSNPENISTMFNTLIGEFAEVEFGAHLHTTPDSWEEKINAAWQSGCRRFDGAIRGYGGCPMAKNELVGNMPTEKMVDFFKIHPEKKELNSEILKEAIIMAETILKS